jgi:hypothetical protein
MVITVVPSDTRAVHDCGNTVSLIGAAAAATDGNNGNTSIT